MRYFIYLQYDGTDYHGWQTQPNATSVQETIEQKLSLLLQRDIFIIGAGRTDAGVHAGLMVAHMETDGIITLQNGKVAVRPNESDLQNHDNNSNHVVQTTDPSEETLDETVSACQQLCQKLNMILPPDIAIVKIIPVRPDAHARFSPTSRTYHYYITTKKSPFDRPYKYRVFWQLDLPLMNEAAQKLFNYEDFTSFSRLHTDVKTNNCRIMKAVWEETSPGEWRFTIQADRFLRNMVRAIVGTLILVGRHKLSVDGFCKIIEGMNRCSAGDSAPGNALFLDEIAYPENIFYPSVQMR